MKFMIYLGVFIGGLIGGYIPALWHAGIFSVWGIILGIVGSLVGIWGGYKIGQYMGM